MAIRVKKRLFRIISVLQKSPISSHFSAFHAKWTSHFLHVSVLLPKIAGVNENNQPAMKQVSKKMRIFAPSPQACISGLVSTASEEALFYARKTLCFANIICKGYEIR